MTLRLPGPPHVSHVYAVECSDGFTLVDAGYPSQECTQALRDAIYETCGDVSHVRRVVLTHYHPDHWALGGWLQQHAGAQVIVHPDDWRWIQQLFSGDDPIPSHIDCLLDEEARQAWAEMGSTHDTRWLPANATFAQGGEVLDFGRKLEIVWTPGHTPGHLCVLDHETRSLLCGDHLLKKITPHVGLWHGEESSDPLSEYEASLRLLASLDPRPTLGLPGHGEIMESAVDRAEEILAHHATRRQEIIELIESGARTAEAVANGLFSIHRTGVNRIFAIAETMAHLRNMETLGLVSALPSLVAARAKISAVQHHEPST